MANTGFRVMYGWVSAAELNNTSGTLITDFPTQSDQDVGRVWVRPGNDADLVMPYAQLVETPTGHRYGQGGTNFKFALRVLSPEMRQHVQDALFPGGVQSSNLTAQSWSRLSGTWEAYNLIGRLPDPSTEAELAAGGFDLYAITFVSGISAPDGPDVSPAQSWTYLTAGLEGRVTFTVTNDGDTTVRASGDTFDDIVLTYEIPTKLDFVSATGTGWTVEYSTDGITYSSVVPTPASNTTHIRGTYTAEIEAGDSTNGLVVTVEPNASDDDTSTVIATTTGDTDTGNDTDTQIISIEARGFDSGFDLGFGAGSFDSGFDGGYS